MTDRSMSLVIFGESGVGKSYLADTAPGPRLVLDAEGGVRFTPSKKVMWNPKDPLPKVEETAVVPVHELSDVQLAYQWLNQGKTPFKSVIIDSLTEVQLTAKTAIAGTGGMQIQSWGALLDRVDNLVRSFRNLTFHPLYPLECVVFVCGAMEVGAANPVTRPMLQGKMANWLPYRADIVTYLGMSRDGDGQAVRTALFDPINNIAAKARRREPVATLGATMESPTIPQIIDAAYGPEEDA